MNTANVLRTGVLVALIGAATACGRFDGRHLVVESFEVTDAIERVELRGAVAHVELTVGTGPVSVRQTTQYRSSRPSTGHEVTGRTLTLTDSGCPKRAGTAGCEITFAIRVPAATAVAIRTDVGHVRARDLAGDLTVDTTVGDVDASGLTGHSVQAHTGTGTVKLRFARPPDRVDARVTVGEVDIRVPTHVRYAIDCDGYAEIDVGRDAGSPHRITVRSPLGISIGAA
jgi:hypothetical protein